jgi:hypothetical protein
MNVTFVTAYYDEKTNSVELVKSNATMDEKIGRVYDIECPVYEKGIEHYNQIEYEYIEVEGKEFYVVYDSDKEFDYFIKEEKTK